MGEAPSVAAYGVVRRADGAVVVAGRAADGKIWDVSRLGGPFAAGSLNGVLEDGPAAVDRMRGVVEGGESGGETLDPASVTSLRPIDPGDYVDFYACEHHAANLGRCPGPVSEPLLPNWRQLPVGYHGRTTTIVVSGADHPAALGPAAADPTRAGGAAEPASRASTSRSRSGSSSVRATARLGPSRPPRRGRASSAWSW